MPLRWNPPLLGCPWRPPKVGPQAAGRAALDAAIALGRDLRADATIIVVGTHGRTGLKRLVLGSTAEVVVRHADRPVLVVPHRDADA